MREIQLYNCKHDIFILSSRFNKPMISLLYNGNEKWALIDTGAMQPMWLKSESSLLDFGGISTGNQKVFYGIGGNDECDEYIIKEFKLGCFIYTNFKIYLSKKLKYKDCDILLPYTMFHSMVVIIDRVNSLFGLYAPDNKENRSLIYFDENNKKIEQVHTSFDDFDIDTTI